LHDEFGHAYNNVNLATTCSRLGRTRSRWLRWIQSDDGDQLHALRERTVRKVEILEARHVANTGHALANLDLRSEGWKALWNLLVAASFQRLDQFKPQNLSSMA
jgi:hypothetical protein